MTTDNIRAKFEKLYDTALKQRNKPYGKNRGDWVPLLESDIIELMHAATASMQAENQKLREALDMAHFYIDAAPFELERKQMTRNDALYKARKLYQALNDTKQSTEGK